MVSIPYEWQGTYNYVASFFSIRPEWLVYPYLVTSFIWPFVLSIFMFYYLFNKIVRVFPGGVNMVLAIIVAFLSLPYSQYTVLVAPLVIAWGVSWDGAAGMAGRIILMGLFYAMTFYILPFVTAYRF